MDAKTQLDNSNACKRLDALEKSVKDLSAHVHDELKASLSELKNKIIKNAINIQTLSGKKDKSLV